MKIDSIQELRIRWPGPMDKILEHIISEDDWLRALAMTNLECRRCGNCCFFPAIFKLGKRADEPCVHLTGNHECSIYEQRPQACRDFPRIMEFPQDHPGISRTWLPQFNCPMVSDFWGNLKKVDRWEKIKPGRKQLVRDMSGVMV